MNELISIIIPVYNVEKYLKECLDSVINQSYTNIEILLIDDGSTDSSSKICKEYCKIDNRIKYYKKKNGGLSSARNYGIKKSTGKYLSFIDSDDIISNNMIQILYNELKKNNCDISVCKYKIFSDSFIYKESNYNKEIIEQENIIINLMIDDKITSHSCNKLYDKNLFNNNQYVVGKKYEDIGTTYKLLLSSKRVVYIDKELYGYRYRNNSITNHLSKNTLLDYIEMINKRYDDLIKYKYELKDYIDMNRINSITRYYLEIVRCNGYILLKDEEVKNKLNEELEIFKNLFKINIIKINSTKHNISNIILLISPKLLLNTMKIFYKIKSKLII